MGKDKTSNEVKNKTTKTKSKAKPKDAVKENSSAAPKAKEEAVKVKKAAKPSTKNVSKNKEIKESPPAKKTATVKVAKKKVKEVQQDFLFEEKPEVPKDAPKKAVSKKVEVAREGVIEKAAPAEEKPAVIEEKPKTVEKPKKEKAKKEEKKAEEQPEIEEDIPLNDEDLKVTGKAKVILQVLPELKSGGVERGTIEIARAGAKYGYKMLVASNGGNLVGQLESAHAKHIYLPLASKNPFTIIGNIKRLKSVIKEYNVDILHARSRAPAWSAYFATRKSKCRFITTFHGTYSYRNPLKKLYNSVMTKGDVVIAISNFIKEHIISDYGVDPKKVKLVPRGVDLEQFTRDKVHKIRMINMASHFSIELDVPVILLPARFTRWKGQSYLLDALSIIKDEKFVCILAGYDKKHQKYYQEMEKKVRERGLFHKVRMIGEIKDMPALYSLSDIVISASTRPEAFGRVSVEGQAMEKLVVATDLGGSRETVINGETGWLVKPDDVEGFAKTLKEVLEIDTKKRKQIADKARKNIEENFSIENMVKKTFAIYKGLLGRGK